ncbi:geranylgeranylglyceryl/heptaprenylglyceryl phosphate synthase [Halorubellus salinus]|uniref:geranylgeranylglyceryl/heptaprenylglyceryl phosphate synthase n=1 Tax=Halorubellus salinus TaxID=755309 RepID=UPI001D079B5B
MDSVLPVDSNPVPPGWTHVTKVDPEEEKRFPLLFPVYLAYTDAISVGGSSDVTDVNTEETFELLNFVQTPTLHEPSDASHVTRKTHEEADFLAIPEVLNGGSDGLVGTLGVGIEYLREDLIPEQIEAELPSWLVALVGDSLAEFLVSWLLEEAVFEAYVIQNPESAAARRGGVSEDDVLNTREAKQRGLAADRHLKSEILYIEYSGMYGGDEAMEILESVAGELSRSQVWYGGGIDSGKKANCMLEAGADAVVVGDIFHRIAEEEASICDQAFDALDSGESVEEIRAWIQDSVEVEGTSAEKFLSTIPSVSNPEEEACEILSATVALSLYLGEELDETVSESEVREVIEEFVRTMGGQWWHKFAEVFPGVESQARRYLENIVLSVPDGSTSDEVPVQHLGWEQLRNSDVD